LTLTPPPARAMLSRSIPRALDGTLCVCPSPQTRGRPHPPSYLLQLGHEQRVGCVSAAAAFAGEHGLPFPLTSATPPERP
jgi:hypothetical protein